jgi:hypothetical protein
MRAYKDLGRFKWHEYEEGAKGFGEMTRWVPSLFNLSMKNVFGTYEQVGQSLEPRKVIMSAYHKSTSMVIYVFIILYFSMIKLGKNFYED